jgi:electron transport complex protein RnfE
MASIREIFGNGTIFGASLFGENFAPALGMVSPSGGFITLGLLIALINKIVSLRQKKKGAH